MNENILLTIGLIGQGAFFSRWLLQYLVSEKCKKCVIPLSFWYLSVLGAALVLIYAILRKDIVFILGQSMGLFIYTRNIFLMKRNKNEEKLL